jgi:hypothetical protein
MKTKSAVEHLSELFNAFMQVEKPQAMLDLVVAQEDAIRTDAQEEALRKAAEVVSKIKWGYDGDCGAEQAILSLITTKETK